MGDDLLDNREADAGAHFAGLLGALRAVELLEDILELLGVHADALIAHRDAHLFAALMCFHGNAGFARRVFDGIGEEIIERVFHQLTISGQRALYRGSQRHEVDFGVYLQDLCASLSQSLVSDDRVTLEVETEPALLPVDTAIPLGMVVNELVTNAAKYAYPEPASGAITVRFGRRDDILVLAVGDGGQGLPGDIEARPGSMGMRLITSLVAQVGGDLKVTRRPGATFVVTLPVAAPDLEQHGPER